MAKIIIEVEANMKQADDIAGELVDYLIHVEGRTVLDYEVSR